MEILKNLYIKDLNHKSSENLFLDKLSRIEKYYSYCMKKYAK